MRHLPEGVLRRLLDEPAGVADADRRHAAGCPTCLDALVAQRHDSAFVGAALATDVDVDVDAAWQRLTSAAPARAAVAQPTRVRALLRRPAAAALAVGLVLSGATAAAANDWLEIFRVERVAPVGITTADLVALPDLSAYGELVVDQEVGVHEVADAATAKAESGLDLPEVADLPAGVTGAPTYQVGRKGSATFTFSAERAAEAARREGEDLPPLPAGLDGARVRLEAGPGVAQVWESNSGAPALVVARAVAPKAFSSGVPFETVRDYVLGLPGVTDEVAAQLRSFAADGSTLPLPVPANRVISRSTQIDGQEATVLTARDRTMSGVVWVRDGVVTVVAGSLDDDEVLTVARALR